MKYRTKHRIMDWAWYLLIVVWTVWLIWAVVIAA